MVNLITSPLFWAGAIIFFIVAYFIGKAIAKKFYSTNFYMRNKKIKQVMENPEILKEKIKNAEVTLSDGKEYKVRGFYDYGGKKIDIDNIEKEYSQRNHAPWSEADRKPFKKQEKDLKNISNIPVPGREGATLNEMPKADFSSEKTPLPSSKSKKRRRGKK